MLMLVIGLILGCSVPILSLVFEHLIESYRVEKFQEKNGDGRIAVVTGAGSGIGRACTLLMAKRGWKIIAVDVNEDGLKETLKQASGDVQTVVADLSDPDGRESMSSEIHDKTDVVSALINCAGVTFPIPLLGLSPEQVQLQFNVNCVATLDVTSKLFDLLQSKANKKIGGGAVINFSSVAGDAYYPWQGAYSPTKFAIDSISGVLRIEARASKLPIRVAVVKPGPVKTAMTSDLSGGMTKFLEEFPDSPFAPGLKASLKRSIENKKSVDMMSLEAEDVAKIVYGAVMDPNMLQSYRALKGPVYVLNAITRLLPESLVELFLSKAI